MAKSKRNWYDRLNALFRSGPTVKRRIRDQRQPRTSTAMELFSKTQSFVYSNAINAYGQYDRMCLDLATKIPVPGSERFKTLGELIERYGIVSVADLYGLVDLPCDYTADKYGWKDLQTAEPIRVDDGYILRLPKALPIN